MDHIGVVFDFNGTMFFDRMYHDKAWQICASDLAMREIGKASVKEHISGKTPKEILEYYMECELTDNMIQQFSEEKERIYRNLLVKDEKILSLAPGMKKFLDYLRQSKIKMAIATTADLQNMMLYHDLFYLEEWFDWDNIFFNDGKIPLKPAPDLYNKAIKSINIPSQHVVAFEDSISGARAAYAAGVRNIIAVTGDTKDSSILNEKGVLTSINDFYDLNENNFK